MPQMDGLTAARTMRAQPGLERIPIIAMTAHAMDSHRHRSMEAGMNDHLSKPIDGQSFYQILMRWFDGRNGGVRMAPADAVEGEEESAFTLPEKLESMDMDDLRRRLGSDHRQLRHLLFNFRESCRKQAIRIAPLLLDESVEKRRKARLLVHSIRGMAANLSAYRLSDLARNLEKAIQDDRLAQGGEQALKAFDRSWRTLLAELDTLPLESVSPGPRIHLNSASTSLDRGEGAEGLIERLRSLIEDRNYRARKLFPDLRARLYGGGYQASLNRLEKRLERYDFSAATKALAQLSELLEKAGPVAAQRVDQPHPSDSR